MEAELAGIPELDGVEHRFIDANGLRMHVALAGPLDGEPAMLVHGWPQHWYEWREIIPPLAGAGYRVICPDLRGLGWTDAPPKGYLKEEMAADLIALLDALGIERVNLAGHDWGGYIGFLLSILYPERVRRYLACNMIHPWIRPDRGYIRRLPVLGYQLPIMIPGFNRQFMKNPTFMHRFLKAGSPHKEAWSDEDVEIFGERFRHPERVHASAEIYRVFNRRELVPMLRGRYRDRRLKAPTVLLFGTKDLVMTPELLGGFEPYADDMKLELVPDAGHFVVDEQPALVAQRALELFGS